MLLAIAGVSNSFAQTKADWERTVEWDGVSHWSKYIQTQAAHMGPNALPIPQIGNGTLDNRTHFGFTGSLHFREGDNTQNITLYGNYALVKDVISFDVTYIPLELFQTSDAVKKERRVFYTHYYDNVACGDVNLNTNVRLLKKLDPKIQLALRIGVRFPTSRDLKSARYTDGTGYSFDLSFGKPLTPSLKWIGMAGFSSWQITGEVYRQDDAFLFGSGLEFNKAGWKIQGYGAGYIGYIKHSGDKPIVVRATAEKRNPRTALLIRLQQGVHDFRYSSAEFGLRYFFADIKNP
jgi:hypothetical protein